MTTNDVLSTIAYLGPEGTFSEEAVLKLMGAACSRQACASFDEVLKQVQEQRVDAGIIAIENNTNGTVTHAIDLLLETPLLISAEVTVSVVHNLLTQSERYDQIESVYAHPQALAQCHRWLSEHLPLARQIPTSSNAQGAKLARSEASSAAIASKRAAQLYGLPVLADSIQDGVSNQTRFLLMTRESVALTEVEVQKWKTSIVFSVPNRPGALYDALFHLADHGVQMSRIESRPARNGAWDYNFYIDIEGRTDQPMVAQALEKVKETATFYRCFGSYPVVIQRLKSPL